MGSNGSTGVARMANSATVWNCSGSGSPPRRCTSPPASSAATDMRFIVNVPVLSTQTTVAEPSVSITGGRRVSTWRCDMRHAPSARKTVSTTGNSSGSMAIAVAMPARNPSSQPPRTSP